MISHVFYESVTDRPTDGPTDGRTDGPTDGWTNGRTDRPGYKDARTHLKTSPPTNCISLPQIPDVYIDVSSLKRANFESRPKILAKERFFRFLTAFSRSSALLAALINPFCLTMGQN